MSYRILIIEDEFIIAADIKSILNSAGFAQVEIADSPEYALSLAEEFSPDIALIDISLNHTIDGIDLAGKLNESYGLPFIFITAFSESGVIERAGTLAPYGFLLKPIRKQDMLISIEMAMRRFNFETGIKRRADNLKDSEKQFRTVFESSPIGIALYNSDWNLVHANRSFLDTFAVEKVEGLNDYNFFKNIKININDISRLNKGEPVRCEIPFDFSLQNPGDPGTRNFIHIDFIISPMEIKPEKGPEWYLIQVQDITGRKKEEENLLELSTIDPLTSAFNRRGFLSMTEKQINIAARAGNEMVLIFVDLDRMKQINDCFGHKAGDRAIAGAYNILKDTFRNSDLIARWGGDEFVILMVNSKCDEQSGIYKRLQENSKLYCKKHKLGYDISMSTGAVKFDPRADTDVELLIEKADQSMYENKKMKSHISLIS